MLKKILPFFLILFFLFSPSIVKALGTLKLNSIGTSSTAGQTFTTWSYSGSNPTFAGEASANAQVQIKIDSVSNTVTANTNGVWTFVPTMMTTSKSYEITISSESEYIVFTLNLTAAGSATPTPTTSSATESATTKGGETLIQSGAVENTLYLIAGGLLFIGLGMVSKVILTREVD